MAGRGFVSVTLAESMSGERVGFSLLVWAGFCLLAGRGGAPPSFQFINQSADHLGIVFVFQGMDT